MTDSCRHVNQVSQDKVLATIMAPDRWTCHECETTDHMILCLYCGKSLCKSHARQHWANERHPIRMELNSEEHGIHCMHCETAVLNDNRRNEISLLRQRLAQVQTLNPDAGGSGTRTGRAYQSKWRVAKRVLYMQYLTPQAVARRRTEDRMRTAIFRWKHQVLLRCFNSWKRYAAVQRGRLPSPPKKPGKMEASESEEEEEEDEEEEEGEDEDEDEDEEEDDDDDEAEAAADSEPEERRSSRRASKRRRSVPTSLIPGRCGLRNLGNTCYMNSVLQALSNMPSFREYYLRKFPSEVEQAQINNKKQVALSRHFNALLDTIWSAKRVVYTPDDLMTATWEMCQQFKGFLQQDAQEFVIFALDRLAAEQQHMRPSGANFISTRFAGSLKSHVRCGRCGNTSDRVSVVLGVLPVQLPPADFEAVNKHPAIKGAAADSAPAPRRRSRRSAAASTRTRTLYECLEYTYATPEPLVEDNQYSCDSCERKTDAEQHLLVEQLPSQYLILHIVRTAFNVKTCRVRKHQAHVQFPLESLDLRRVLPLNRKDSRDAIFDLVAVVNHHGRGMQEGHFTSFGFNSVEDSWLLFNDANVRPATEKEVASSQAYMLFYERRRKRHNHKSAPQYTPLSTLPEDSSDGGGSDEEEDDEDNNDVQDAGDVPEAPNPKKRKVAKRRSRKTASAAAAAASNAGSKRKASRRGRKDRQRRKRS